MVMNSTQPKRGPLRRISTLQHTPVTLERCYTLMGEALLFQTNDPLLLEAADEAFGRFPAPDENSTDPLIVRLFVHQVGGESAPTESGTRPNPIYRTQAHYLYFTVGAENTAVIDIAHGFAYGFVAPDIARDRAYVRVTFIEAMGLAMLSIARKYAYIHAACVIKDGISIILQGKNGAGKSSLVYACARRGYQVLAEDVVFVKIQPGRSALWGMPWKIYLLPDARQFFPELADHDARLQLNGEMKLEVNLDALWPDCAITHAEPGLAVMLKRGTGGSTRIEPVDLNQALQEAQVLWPWATGWSEEYDGGIQQLYERGTYNLHFNAAPDSGVDALDELIHAVSRGKSYP